MRPAGPHVERLGETAVVLSADGAPSMPVQRKIWNLAAAVRGWSGVEEAVAGMNNLTLFADASRRVAEIESRLKRAWEESPPEWPAGTTVEIPVAYGSTDGPDLAEVARACGCSEQEVAALHFEREYEVYFLGFQPGFAYLGDLDERLRLPRRAHPRASVPAGSVAIAERMTGIYPATSPGGWHVIGRTTMRLFDAERNPPALLMPGDRVRFVHAVDR